MSSLVHLGRVAAAQAELARPTRTEPPEAVPEPPAGHGSTAADLMTQRPPVVHHGASLWSAWRPMAAHRTPVRTLLRGRAPPRVLGSADLGVVARTMVGAQVDALPVVDREGRLLGLITLRHLAELAAGASIQPQSSAG